MPRVQLVAKKDLQTIFGQYPTAAEKESIRRSLLTPSFFGKLPYFGFSLLDFGYG
jgi:hypothetical protein